MSSLLNLQAFLFRNITTNVAVERLQEQGMLNPGSAPSATTESSLLGQFSLPIRLNAEKMSDVYILLFCFENSVREFVESRLKETFGVDDWWIKGVPEKIRISAEKKKQKEDKARWHGDRGGSMLSFVDFPELGDIILEQWSEFEVLLGESEWVAAMFREFNVSRRVLAHTGILAQADVDRIEFKAREWLRVVG